MRHRRRRLARGRRSLRAAWWRGYRFAVAVERWRTSLVAGIVFDETGPELTPEQMVLGGIQFVEVTREQALEMYPDPDDSALG